MEEKNKRTNTGLGELQAQERRSLWHCAFWEQTRACTRAKILTKPLVMLTYSRVGSPGLCESTGLSSRLSDFCWLSSLLCFHLLTASFCQLCPSLDCYLKPTVLFCSLLLTHFFCLLSGLHSFLPSFLPSFTHFRSRGRSRAQALCVGFVPKQTKGFSDWHLHTPTQRMLNIVSQTYFYNVFSGGGNWLLSQTDCSLLLPSTDPLLLSSLGPSFLPSPTSGLVGDLVRRPFVWVSCRNRQRDSLPGTYTHQHNECPTSCRKPSFIMFFRGGG